MISIGSCDNNCCMLLVCAWYVKVCVYPGYICMVHVYDGFLLVDEQYKIPHKGYDVETKVNIV